MMNIVFMGTPSFAVTALRALASDEDERFSIKLVFTRPDAASARGTALLPSPVHLCAKKLGIPVQTPRGFYAYAGEEVKVQQSHACDFSAVSEPTLEPRKPPPCANNSSLPSERVPLFDTRGNRVVDAKLLAHIAAVEPDVIVVAAYGMILPPQVLDLPRYGCVNIHASLLPRWRGSAPIQRAILAGDEQSGVSIMRMEKGLDTGAVCDVATMPIKGRYASEVTDDLAVLGAKLLMRTLPHIVDGSAVWTAQDENQVTYADKVGKRELMLRPTDVADVNIRRVLASSAQAPARCVIANRSLTVLAAQPFFLSPSFSLVSPLSPGEARLFDKRLVLGTVDGAFEVTVLKPDGKKEMSAAAFALGVKELQKDIQGLISWNDLVQGVK
jgi:methionyl-tRNA formyltransferase